MADHIPPQIPHQQGQPAPTRLILEQPRSRLGGRLAWIITGIAPRRQQTLCLIGSAPHSPKV
jgi:hypothetical protein